MTRPPTGPDAGADDAGPSAAAGRNNGQLSRSMILQAALAIVDRDGVDRLSMRRLSDALGRDPVMLYRHVPSKAAVGAAFAATTRATVAIIAELNRQIAELETTLAEHFETHPDADIYLSLPGLGVVLGARVLGEFGDDPNRYTDVKSRRNYAGTSPLTVASGKKRVVRPATCATAVFMTLSTDGPSAPCQPVRAPACSTTSAARPKTPTTKHCAPSVTASSASCMAACATTPTTTKPPPGPTACQRRLDDLRPWDV
jgi:AcrR family transcriptional regulator